MRDYIIRRVLLLIPNLFILATLTFFLARVLPGDVALGLATVDGNIIDQETVQTIRDRLGLNDPLPVQYARFMLQLLSGDLGHSDVSDQSVATVVAHTAEVTFLLAILSVFIGAAMAIPFGILSAMMRGRWPDQIIRTFSAVFLALPNFWLGILLLLALVTWFSWSPPIFNETFLDAPSPSSKGSSSRPSPSEHRSPQSPHASPDPPCWRCSTRTTSEPPALKASSQTASLSATRYPTPYSPSSHSPHFCSLAS